jgi:thiamine monophosphate synthase
VVAIGGITRANFRSVVDAGADSVAVIGNLLVDCTASNLESQLTQNIRDFLD